MRGMSIARCRRRVDCQRDALFDSREPHERWASLRSHPKKIGMLQPGKSARRTRSCDRGESHGQTRLAYEKKEDEGASTWAAATLNSRQRDRHHAHHCASKSPLELQRCRVQHTICRGAEVPSSTHLPPISRWDQSGCASNRFENPPWASIPEQQNSRYVSPWYAQYP